MVANPLLSERMGVWGELRVFLAHPPSSTSPSHNTVLRSLAKSPVKPPERCCAEPRSWRNLLEPSLGRGSPVLEAGEKPPI